MKLDMTNTVIRERGKKIKAVVKRINQAAGKAREEFITEISGQQMLYMKKEAEAREWVAATNPDIANFPLIAAEVGITAATADDVANLYITRSQQYLQLAAQLEHARLSAIATAENSANLDTANNAADQFEAVLASGSWAS